MHMISTEAELAALYDTPVPTSLLKEVDHVTAQADVIDHDRALGGRPVCGDALAIGEEAGILLVVAGFGELPGRAGGRRRGRRAGRASR